MNQKNCQAIENRQQKDTFSGQKPSAMQDQAAIQKLEKDGIFGPEKTREQVMEELKADPEVFRKFQQLSPKLQEELVEFSMGVRGLNVTYDPVFKKI